MGGWGRGGEGRGGEERRVEAVRASEQATTGCSRKGREGRAGATNHATDLRIYRNRYELRPRKRALGLECSTPTGADRVSSNKRLHNFADAALQCHSLCPSFQTSGDCQPGMHIATRPSTMHCVSYAVCTTLCNLGPQPCGSPGGACAAGSCSWRGWSAREPVHRRIASPTRHRAALPPGKNDGTDKMTSGEIEMWSHSAAVPPGRCDGTH